MPSYPSSETNGRYNVIYVENHAFDYPVSQAILAKNTGATIIRIHNYKDVFNRSRQNPIYQKQHPSLILAVKPEPFLYLGPDVCQNFGYDAFYYSNFLLNCPFDCEYCYLGGMYTSAHPVAFVNTEDFRKSILDTSRKHERMLLALSYDTDLAAFDGMYSYTREVSGWLNDMPGLSIEFRTKSANTALIQNLRPSSSLIFAFSLSPQSVIDRYERHTPGLEARIRTVKAALSAGHPVRLCFDPVFTDDTFREDYDLFFEHIFKRLPADKIRDVSYGFFRMNDAFFKRIARYRPNSLLYLDDYEITDHVVGVQSDLRESVSSRHLEKIYAHIPKERVFVL